MEEVNMARMRPNFVLGGTGPHEEDDWLELQMGEVINKSIT